MKRFGLVMTDELYNDFYRIFPDHGMRTAALRKCVQRMVKRAHLLSTACVMVDDIADEVKKEMEEKYDG
jgi:hypothetical protein